MNEIWYVCYALCMYSRTALYNLVSPEIPPHTGPKSAKWGIDEAAFHIVYALRCTSKYMLS